MHVVVLGGYGNFGARICRALAERGFEVTACGRDPDRGHCNAGFDARIGKARVDIFDANLEERLGVLAPGIVIHCAGPFQGQDYRVARTSLDIGAHYIDLADGRSFVANFAAAMRPAARAAGLLAVSGVSTLPALSSAVIDALKGRYASLDEILIAIAPAQRSPRGAATMRAVFEYLGKPFPWLVDGTWTRAYGWQELRRLYFAGLGKRWAAACDVPDLDLLPARYVDVRTVQFRASLEFGVQHFLLAAVAGLRRIGLPFPLERWVEPVDQLTSWFDRFGGEYGGMLVSLVGRRHDGRKVQVEWHLTASSEHGPEIPCIAAILLAAKLIRSEIKVRDAMPCMGLLTLDEFVSEFARWNIQTQIKEHKFD